LVVDPRDAELVELLRLKHVLERKEILIGLCSEGANAGGDISYGTDEGSPKEV
jgi:hypothetical protein